MIVSILTNFISFIDCLVPSPVTNLSVTNVSTTDITVNWIVVYTNYVTYYIIFYTPYCPELSSVNVTVFVVPYTTTYIYTLRELYSGMNYTISVRAGNILGESISVKLVNETKPTGNLFVTVTIAFLNLVPTGNVRSLNVSQINQISIRIMWEEVDCDQHNGRIIEYIVVISNNSNTYSLTSTERYITVNDLVLGGIYRISVAAVNSIGVGPFGDYVEIEIVKGTVL